MLENQTSFSQPGSTRIILLFNPSLKLPCPGAEFRELYNLDAHSKSWRGVESCERKEGTVGAGD
jgi:hypothetical protein